MKRLGLGLLFLLVAALLALATEQPNHASARNAPAYKDDEVRIVRVIDGDSMIVEINGFPAELRLLGIDTPESRQEWGKEATDFTRQWTRGALLRLEFGPKRTDRYDRLLAYVWKNETLLNEQLVQAGLALPYMLPKKAPHFARINNALQQAKAQKAGFWKQGGLKLEPRLWRKKHR